jgi:hypothetical protein
LNISGDEGGVNDTFPDPFGETDAGHARRIETFPLHFCIMMDKSPSVVSYIVGSHGKDVNSIRTPDDMGLTPVYIAAASGNYRALEALISLGVTDQLKDRSNAYKSTPLEACEQSLSARRRFLKTFGLEGFTPNAEDAESEKGLLLCIVKLKRAMGMLEMENMTDEEYVEQIKYGCTCEVCAGGFLSPRMRFRLMCKPPLILSRSMR